MVKFHYNDAALRHAAQILPADREGRLLYRTSKDSYKERWFKLSGNLLFYFKTNERGAIATNAGSGGVSGGSATMDSATDPVGVLVLASCRAQLEDYGDRPFVFSVVFDGEDGRKHFFSGQSWQQCTDWVTAIRRSAHADLRSRLDELRQRVRELTGVDPLRDCIARRRPPRPAAARKPAFSAVPTLPPPPSTRSATFYVESLAERLPSSAPATGSVLHRRPTPARAAPERPVPVFAPLAAVPSAVEPPPQPTAAGVPFQLVDTGMQQFAAAAAGASVVPAASKPFGNWETFF